MMCSTDDKLLYKPARADRASYNLVMGFPGPESFALSSLGYLWLNKLMQERDDINVFSAAEDTIDKMILPSSIDAISFSVSFEMDIMSVFTILEKLNIPVRAMDRENVLVFAGGPVITSNPAPFAGFFDFFLIGDGEELLNSVMDVLTVNKGLKKEELLKKLLQIEGVYIPALKNKANKVTHKVSDCVFTPVISSRAYFKDTFIIEVERGCYNRCGFCLASYLNLPVRFLPYEDIINKIDLGLGYTKNIALLGAQISAHPAFDKICRYVISKIENGQDINLNFSSLRVDAITQEVLHLLKLSGQKTFTIAIEAATERLRSIINKNISEEQIFNAVELAADAGLKGIKFYCMIGLPCEQEEDVKAFIDLGRMIKKNYKSLDIMFSFSSFIPKPHTPFQWTARETTSSLEKKEKYLTKELAKIGVKSKFTSFKWDYYQTLISRGDETLSSYLYRVYQLGGKLGAYKAAARELGIDTDYFVTRPFLFEERLPWDDITIKKPGKEFLKKEYNRLMNISGLE